MQVKFIKEFEKLGGKIVLVESGDETDEDFRAQFTKLKNAKPEALFMPTYSKQGGRAVKQARELGIKLPLFGADPWDVPEFKEAAGSAAEGVLFTVFDQYTGEEYQRMAKEYKNRYGEEPDFIAASGYDCLLVLYNGMQELINSNIDISGENLSKVLLKVKITGATGLNEFDENGDVISKKFTQKTIKNNDIVKIN